MVSFDHRISCAYYAFEYNSAPASSNSRDFSLRPFIKRFLLGDLLLRGTLSDVVGDADGAPVPERRPTGNAPRCLSWRARLGASAHRGEVWPAHGAEMSRFGGI